MTQAASTDVSALKDSGAPRTARDVRRFLPCNVFTARAIGTEFLAHGDKIELTGHGLDMRVSLRCRRASE